MFKITGQKFPYFFNLLIFRFFVQVLNLVFIICILQTSVKRNSKMIIGENR